VKKLAIKPLIAIIALPNISLSTRHARTVLPESVAMRDAIFNIGRTALLINALQGNDYEYLRIAMQDSIHQPYRLGLIPGAEEAISGSLAAGALGAALSGAGPSIISFLEKEDKKVGKTLLQAFKNANLPARLFTTTTINQGAQVILK
jgi:homoserine kinase